LLSNCHSERSERTCCLPFFVYVVANVVGQRKLDFRFLIAFWEHEQKTGDSRFARYARNDNQKGKNKEQRQEQRQPTFSLLRELLYLASKNRLWRDLFDLAEQEKVTADAQEQINRRDAKCP
jgi:hypothetical protein